jgi:hypothetical protein
VDATVPDYVKNREPLYREEAGHPAAASSMTPEQVSDERSKVLASGMVNLANIVLAGAALTPLFTRGVVDLVWVVGGFFCWVVLFTGAMEAIGEAVWW